MSKKFLGLIVASCALSSTIGAVHEIRTPITLLSKLNNINGSFSYPLKQVDYEKTNVDIWAGAYYRSAFNGYCPKNCGGCCGNPEICQADTCNYNFFAPNNCCCVQGSLQRDCRGKK